MTRELDRLPEGGRVAVIRVRSLGDCVLTTPALRILKDSRPDLRVGVVVESRFAAVFEGNSDVDSILEPSIRAVARFRPDLAINFHGGTRSIALTLGSGARRRAGFGHYRAPRIYNVVMPRAQEVLGEERVMHTAEHLGSGMFYLGAPMRPIPRARLFAELAPTERRPYVVIHPFASSAEKAWPIQRWVELCRASINGAQTSREPDLTPRLVILCGPNDDASSFAEFECVRSAPLAQVKSLIAGAALFIGNDSGPAHMACALGIPEVVLFGPSDPVVWAPWKPVAPAETITSRTMTEITVARVRQALEKVQAYA